MCVALFARRLTYNITQAHMQTMQQAHMHKAVARRVEVKMLLSRRRQSDFRHIFSCFSLRSYLYPWENIIKRNANVLILRQCIIEANVSRHLQVLSEAAYIPKKTIWYGNTNVRILKQCIIEVHNITKYSCFLVRGYWYPYEYKICWIYLNGD